MVRRTVKVGGVVLFLLALQACSRAYLYLVATEDCWCEVYRHRDDRRGIEVEFRLLP